MKKWINTTIVSQLTNHFIFYNLTFLSPCYAFLWCNVYERKYTDNKNTKQFFGTLFYVG